MGTIIEQSSRDIKKHILGSLRDPNHLRLLRTRIYCDQRLIFFHNITKQFLVLCDAKLNRVLENLVQSRFPANLRTCFSPVSPFVLQLAWSNLDSISSSSSSRTINTPLCLVLSPPLHFSRFTTMFLLPSFILASENRSSSSIFPLFLLRPILPCFEDIHLSGFYFAMQPVLL